MPAADKAKGKKAAPPDGAPPVPPVASAVSAQPEAAETKPKAPEFTTEQEIADLEGRIGSDQARLAELRAKKAFVEFPKMVKGHIFNSRAEQDAAGPEFADA